MRDESRLFHRGAHLEDVRNTKNACLFVEILLSPVDLRPRRSRTIIESMQELGKNSLIYFLIIPTLTRQFPEQRGQTKITLSLRSEELLYQILQTSYISSQDLGLANQIDIKVHLLRSQRE